MVYEFIAFGGRHIYPDKDDDEDEEYHEICSQQIDGTMKHFICKISIILSSMTVALIWPTYQVFSHGIRTTALQVKLPFIEEKSNAEFLGDFILQCIILGHGLLGYVGLEVGIETPTDFILISQKLLEYRLKKMDDQQEIEPLTHSQLFSVLRNVVQRIHDYDKYGH